MLFCDFKTIEDMHTALSRYTHTTQSEGCKQQLVTFSFDMASYLAKYEILNNRDTIHTDPETPADVPKCAK